MAPSPPPESRNNTWFIFVLLYLVVEFARPQDILSLTFLRLGMVSILILTGFIISNFDSRIWSIRQVRLIVYFTVLTALYVPLARNTFFSYTTFRTMFLYLPFFFSVVLTVKDVHRFRKLISTNINLMVFISLYALTHGGRGPGSFLSDENDLALFINTYLPFAYYLLFYETDKRLKAFYFLSILLGISANILSLSRGGFLGMLGIALTITIFNKRKLLVPLSVLTTAFLVFSLAGDKYLKEIASITQTDSGTARIRTLTWRAAWDMFCAHPLGVGGNNFQVHFPEFQPEEFKRGMWGRVAHSLWFTLLPEMGIIGTALYLILLLSNLKDIRFLVRSKPGASHDLLYFQTIGRCLLASLVGFLISGTFLSVLYYPEFWYITAILVSAVLVARGLKDLPENQTLHHPSIGPSSIGQRLIERSPYTNQL